MDETRRDIPTSSAAEPGTLSRLWWWIRLVVVIGLLAGLITLVGPRQLWQTLQGVQWLWIIAAAPFAMAAALADALKLALLMKPHAYRGGWLSILRTSLVVNFVSLFLPGTVGGGIVAWYRLSKRDKLHAESFVALSVNSVLKLVVACLAAAVGLAGDAAVSAGQRGLFGSGTPPLFLWLVVAGAAPLLALILILHTRLIVVLGRGLHRLSAVSWMPSRLSGAIAKVLQAIEAYRSKSIFVYSALALAFSRKLLENVCYLMAVRAVGAEVGFARLLWIMCTVEVCGMIPLSLGGLGVPQVTYCALLAKFGMKGVHAVASNVVSWVIFLPVYLAGAAVLLAESLERRRGPSGPR